MKIKLLLTFSFLFLSNLSEANVEYWGPTGHRTTGEIAEKHLTKKAKRIGRL